jgi:hypothetical protein
MIPKEQKIISITTQQYWNPTDVINDFNKLIELGWIIHQVITYNDGIFLVILYKY